MHATKRQLEAINSRERTIIVLAPPGSGKTFTLTEAVKKREGKKIAITFTRAAAWELRERAQMPKTSDDGSFAGTIHSFCYHLLRERGYPLAGRIAIKKMKKLIGDLLGIRPADLRDDEESYLSEPDDGVAEFLAIYDKTTVLDMDVEKGFTRFYPETRFINTLNPLSAFRIYHTFLEEKKANGWLTFADLLQLALKELRAYPVRADFIALDEAQDIDPLQAQILQELMSHSVQSMMVGDDDQCIYGWRLATLEPLLSWPGHRIVLDRSFRVPEEIAQVAQNLIRHNTHRVEKRWTSSHAGGQIDWHRIPLDHALELEKESFTTTTVSILARINKSLTLVERFLKDAGIPYQVIGRSGFFQSKQIKTTLDWLRFLFHRKGFLHTPPPAEKLALSLYGIGEKRWGKYTTGDNPNRALMTLLTEKFPFLKQLFDADPSVVELKDAIETISLSIRRKADYQIIGALEETFKQYGMTAFDKIDHPDVTLSTIHRFKGKEDENIMVLNCHFGEMPHPKAQNSEEERRIAYVAFTRPKRKLVLHSSPEKRPHFINEMKMRTQNARLGNNQIVCNGLSGDKKLLCGIPRRG